jgi:2-hydroxy-4-(methylsulfanyl)butanoate S-methyltransferase
MVSPLTEVREISHLAYGFIASKALFAALNLQLFGHISDGAVTVEALSERTGLPQHRLQTLIAALVSSGVILRDGNVVANAPATDRYLVPGSPAYFGDYYRYQIGGQIYGMLTDLDAGLCGDREGMQFDHMSSWLSDPSRAEDFSRAQHAGSLGPAIVMSKVLDLSEATKLLDVAGGTGAFSITLCQKNPDLTATVIDFPTVVEVAERFIDETGLSSRISLIGGDAREAKWPEDQDVVLMSYLLSAVDGKDIPLLLRNAMASLRPGGRLVVHDFMLNDERTGPSSAALFFLVYMAFQPDAVSFTAEEMSEFVSSAGFVEISSSTLIPEITMMVSAKKPH